MKHLRFFWVGRNILRYQFSRVLSDFLCWLVAECHFSIHVCQKCIQGNKKPTRSRDSPLTYQTRTSVWLMLKMKSRKRHRIFEYAYIDVNIIIYIYIYSIISFYHYYHLLIHSFMYLFIYLFICSFIHLFIYHINMYTYIHMIQNNT